MKLYWRALLIQVLCLWRDFHDTGTKQTGDCERCGLPVGAGGRATR